VHAADATAGKGDFWILKTGYAASPKNLSKNVLPIKGVAISGRTTWSTSSTRSNKFGSPPRVFDKAS